MPTFNFKCDKCGHMFEDLVIGNRPIVCPKCKSKKISQTLTLPEGLKLKFKGEGFHATDYRSDMVREYV